MKQFAFPIGVKCSNPDEYKQCLDIIKSIGDRRITDEQLGGAYNYLHVYLTFTKTGVYDSWGGREDNMYYIDHFNPGLIRDIAAACTNDTWQEGEPIFDCVNNHMNYRNMHKEGCRKIDHYASLRRPTLTEICAHHGYEIKGRYIVKKVETVSNCDKSYCETVRQLDEAKAEIKRLEERLIPVNQMSACVEQVGNAMKLMKDLKEASQKTKIETLDHELARLRSENAELKELMRKRPTVFDSSSVNGGYLITFENKEDNCIEIAFCGKGKFEKVLKALHD